jgi:multidrug efflux system membrane fusion protein
MRHEPAPASSAPGAADPAASSRDFRDRQRQYRRLKITGLVALCLAALVVIAGVISRANGSADLKTWTKAQAIPAVSVLNPVADVGAEPLVLPGSLEADYNAPIYSRVSGYVHAWYVDIGADVRAGQVLATIDTPELDQQLIQARADLETAKANVSLAATTAKRWTSLLAQDAVSKQETDEKNGDLAAKSAMVNAAQANVDRLLALKSFSRITAPFAGVVTARRTDIGDLVNAGAGATANSELFDVAKVDKLRLYVRVPQSFSARIAPGATADVTVPEYLNRHFTATLTTTSNAVSDNSGTLLVEMAVDNRDGALKAGDYAHVKFNLPAPTSVGNTQLRIPASALLFRKGGTEVAVVQSDSRVQIRHVTVGLDLGQFLEIASGLQASDRVIDNPPDSVASGDLVRVVEPLAGANAADRTGG